VLLELLSKSGTCPQVGCQKKVASSDIVVNEAVLADIATYYRRKNREKQLADELEEAEEALQAPIKKRKN